MNCTNLSQLRRTVGVGFGAIFANRQPRGASGGHAIGTVVRSCCGDPHGSHGVYNSSYGMNLSVRRLPARSKVDAGRSRIIVRSLTSLFMLRVDRASSDALTSHCRNETCASRASFAGRTRRLRTQLREPSPCCWVRRFHHE